MRPGGERASAPSPLHHKHSGVFAVGSPTRAAERMCSASVRPRPTDVQGARQKVTFPRTCEVEALLREAR